MILSPTLAVNEEIARRRARGLDTVALGFGEASIPVHPELARRLGQEAAAASYGPVAGVPELREAVAGWFDRRGLPTDPGEIVAGPGTKPLLFGLLHVLGGPLALPCPSWVSYAAQARLLGMPHVLVPTREREGGVPDPELLDAEATRRAAAGSPLTSVLVTVPDNPTGTVASPALVRRLCEVAERHDLVVISDEIYADLVHDGSPITSPAHLVPERTVVTTGLSKNLALGGWRIGVARFPGGGRLGEVRAELTSVASEVWSSPAQPVQRVAAWAYDEPEELRERIAASRVLHGRVARAVAEVLDGHGVRVPAPAAGFYLYPDFESVRGVLAGAGVRTSDALAGVLIDRHGVATLPGTAFGDDPGRLTLRLATPMLYGRDPEQRSRALESDAPTALPWVAAALEAFDRAIGALLA